MYMRVLYLYGKAFVAITEKFTTMNENENIKSEEMNQEEVLNEENVEKTAEGTQEAQNTEDCSAEPEVEKTELEILQEKLDEQLRQTAAMQDKYLRLMAEFDNYRKRTIAEKADLIKNAGAKIITEILPVLDDFERALKNMENAEDVASVREGVDLIYQKFLKTLQQQGLQPIDTKDADFNTDFHEAIALVPAPVQELKGKVLDCVQTGYTLNEKVIRHAKVAVAQ